jgi:hypothetical protein
METNPLLEETRVVWQARTGRKLSLEDAREIAENVAGFFGVLAAWTALQIDGNEGTETGSAQHDA